MSQVKISADFLVNTTLAGQASPMIRYRTRDITQLPTGCGCRFIGTTQPVVSIRIAQLESELGVQLIDRERRRVNLTSKRPRLLGAP